MMYSNVPIPHPTECEVRSKQDQFAAHLKSNPTRKADIPPEKPDAGYRLQALAI
jgi:hypothetical protein